MKRILSLAVVTLVLLTNVSHSLALSDEQKQVLDSGAYYVNVAGTCGTADPIGETDNKVYLLGDSLLVGSYYLNSFLEDNLRANNWSPYADASVGRSITGGGSDPANTRPGHEQPGLQAIDTDADTIKDPKTSAVVIELGTNTSGSASQFEDQVKQVVKKVQDLNKTAKIYWVNIVSKGDPLYSQYNNKLEALEKDTGFSLIDASSQNIELGGDNLHPTTNGYKKYAKYISSKLGKVNDVGASSASNPDICCSTEGATSLVGNDPEEKTWSYFKSKGLSNEQTAGIMGNIKQESGFDPQNIENPAGRSKDPYKALGKGWGLIQWTGDNTTTPGDRTTGDKVTQAYKQSGVSGNIYDLKTQLDMIWQHMHNHPGITRGDFDLNYFKTLNSEVDAGKYFGLHIEGFGIEGDRFQDATDILHKYATAQNGANQVVTDVSGGDCSQITTPGQDTKFIEGFTVYQQCDAQWASKPYSSSTVCESGCGPSAMAMIITNLTGRQVTPDETSRFAASRGLYVSGEGSSWSIGPVLAKHWGLKAQAIGADGAKIAATLQAGGLVITAGQGAKPFTSGGHFIVIRGLTADGKWKVGDSGHNDTSDKEWEPSQLLASMAGGSVYAISK
jgi:lysophospholipase L1-like esterase